MQLLNVVYTFYTQRPDFVSNDTRFTNWVLIAPEAGEFEFHLDESRGVCGFGSFVAVAPTGRFDRRALMSGISYHVFQWKWSELATQFAPGLHRIADIERLSNTLERLRPLFGVSDEWSRARRENLLADLLLMCREPPPAPRQHSGDLLLMQRAQTLLREGAGQSFSMRTISEQVGLSPVQFTRSFRATWGETPIEFLTRIRLEKAASLLLQTEQTLEEIASQCGYATPFYLSHLFSKRYGQSPSAFRRKHRV